MKFEKKESSPCVIALSVNADAEEIKGEYQKVLNVFLRQGVIPGFRKGKVPLAVIKQKFQQEIADESKQACFRALYPNALKESGLEEVAVNLQNVTDVLFAPETGFSFTALVEVKPAFDLPKYKKLSLKKGDTSVSEEQVTARVESFRRAFAKFEDAKDGDVIGDGDFVQFDYSGTLADKAKTPLSDVVPDQKAICSATGFWTQIEEGRFLPEILDALKGMKAGESKDDVEVKFPKDAAPEPLKGKKARYALAVKAFRRRVLPDDETFVKDAKAESMDALRKQFREQMEKDAVAAELEARKNQAIELLLKKSDFDVPPSLVQRQVQAYLQDLAQRAQYSGMSADYIEQNRDQILADAETNATRQVRLSYILLGIAKAENLEATDADVTAGLEKMAAANGKTAEELRKQMEENDQADLYKEQLRAEKALDFVLDEAK
ncbi:MAG: trigger factor [Kiritimatiellae bacterium]|nr:trigger factor [Kiritimatiellia bacterium]